MNKSDYLNYAKLREHQYRIIEAKNIIMKSLELCKKPYVACSFGKDSIVLLHMVSMIKPGIDVIYVRTDDYDDWPGTVDLAEWYSNNLPIQLHYVQAMPITETYRMAGRFYVFAETEAEKKADKLYAQSFFDAIKKRANELNCDLAFIGLRREESKRRNILLLRRGYLFYANKNKILESFPLANWLGRDVWAYIYANNLPYLQLYDLADDRERARNGAMFAAGVVSIGDTQNYFGQLAALKRMYPDLFNKFASEFPDVRLYV